MPSDKLHILQLEPYDDTTSIRDRLTFVAANRAVLVWPATTRILQRKLDLLLLQRHAMRQGLWIALVTTDPVVLDHAHDLNISVFPSVHAARRTPWRRPHYKVFAPPARDPAEQASLAERVYRLRGELPLSPAGRRWRQIVRWGLSVALVVALIAGFFLIAPRATVTITPASDQIFQTVTIIADPNLSQIDFAGQRIPAPIIFGEAESHVTMPSTGRDTVTRTPAEGVITLTNTSDAPQVVTATSVVSTNDAPPIRFETLSEVILPPGEAGSVRIRALPDSAGTLGNVRPGAITRIEGNLSGQVTVTNPHPTTGGSLQEMATVLAEDREAVDSKGTDILKLNAQNTLPYQLPEHQILVSGSITVVPGTERKAYSAVVGEQAETLRLDLYARVRATTIDTRLAERVAYSALAPQIPPGREVSPDAIHYEITYLGAPDANGAIPLEMTVTGYSVVSIRPDEVRERVTGVNTSEASQRLQRDLLLDPNHPPEIDVWPGWYGQLPLLPVRIEVEVNLP